MIRQDFSNLKDEAIIWRYLDFTKFIALLEYKALYFSRVDKFDDPFEGATSKYNIKFRPIVYKKMLSDSPNMFKQMGKFQKVFLQFILVNCWHLNESESYAMWKIYLKSNEGIAIKSTIGSLRKCFTDEHKDKLQIEAVNYIDYEKDWLPEGNIVYPVIHKRKSFSYESEVRVIYTEFKSKPSENKDEPGTLLLDKPIYTHGKNISVDLTELVDEIYIAPTSPRWFKDLAQSLIKRYGFDHKKVVQSSLDDSPLY